jgi:hypothetical protein
MKYIILLLSALFLNNSFALDEGLSQDVFKKRVYKENKETIDRKQQLILDSKRMNLEDLQNKYTKEEVDYIKRINEVYDNQNIEVKKNLKPIDNLKDIE